MNTTTEYRKHLGCRKPYTCVECPECGTHSQGDMGADGPELDTTPCQGTDTCRKQLCSNCPQVVCYCCGLTSCPEHIQEIDGEPWCEVCRKQADDCAAEAKQIPARRVGGVR